MIVNSVSCSIKPRVAFNGMFRRVREDVYTDLEQRYEITSIHSIYYPNKDESEEEIKKAMSEHEHSENSGGGMVRDGGVDKDGKPTMTQGWCYYTDYTCERGGRLPF